MQTISDVEGLRMKHLLPTERIAARCARCDRGSSFLVSDLKRGFLPDWPVWWLEDAMTVYCEARKVGGECRRWFVSPDYGVGA